MKEFKKSIAYFLTIVFMSPLFISCSNSEVLNDDLTYSELAKKYKGIRSKTSDFLGKVYLIANKKKSMNGLAITQTLVDEYAVEAGFQVGEIDVLMIDEVFADYKSVENIGFEAVIESKSMSAYTKRKLIEISRGNILLNLEGNQNFINLPINEKEVITLSNVYLQEMNSGIYMSKMAPDGFMAWIVLGAIGGYLYGGVPGAIAGAFLGLVSALSKNAQ